LSAAADTLRAMVKLEVQGRPQRPPADDEVTTSLGFLEFYCTTRHNG
jgi:hypothetical protein